MSEENIVSIQQMNLGDSAADGLLSGLGAGVVMAVYLAAAALLTGASVAATFARFAVKSGASSPLSGILLHLAVSGVYGLPFGIAAGAVAGARRPLILRAAVGIGYGGLLFALARLIILPTMNSPLQELPPLHFALAHGVYGLVLGLLASRKRDI